MRHVPTPAPVPDQLRQLITSALATVIDPELRRPITDLGMVRSIESQPRTGSQPSTGSPSSTDSQADAGALPDGSAQVHIAVGIDLTVATCPLRKTIEADVIAAVSSVPGVASVVVDFGVMTAEQRKNLTDTLKEARAAAGGFGRGAGASIPFAQPGSLTTVYAVASGKGGVGKSTVTANLAVALAQRGLTVGVVDCDIYGFSIPRMLGISDMPTRVDDLLLPPVSPLLASAGQTPAADADADAAEAASPAHASGSAGTGHQGCVKVMSIGMFVPQGTAVAWRGPKLHRAIEQFLADTYWGDLDILLLDLPPGTGDVALSVAQLLPGSQLLVVTTPQAAAAEVAQRAGSIAKQTHQQVVGVIENMSWLQQPDGSRLELFGAGGGSQVAQSLSSLLGTSVPLLGQIPVELAVRVGGDTGQPVVVSQPGSEAASSLTAIAGQLASRSRGLAGKRLNLSVVPQA